MNIDLIEAKISLRFGNLNISLIRMNHSVIVSDYPKHSHGRRFYEVHYIESGSGKFICSGTEYPVESGMLIMTGPFIVHEQITDLSNPMVEYCFEFEIKEIGRKEPTQEAAMLRDTNFWIGVDTQNMLQKFQRLETESENRNICYAEAISSILTEILIDLARNYNGCSKPQKYTKITANERRMLITDEILLFEYATITLDGLSKRLGLSNRQTQRFLNKIYGKSFIQLRTKRRQEKARELIQSGISPQKAAAMVGYEKAQSLKTSKKQS